MGKTTLMRMIEYQLHKRLDAGERPIVIPVYIDLNYDPPRSQVDFFQRLVNRLSKWHEDVTGIVDPLPRVKEEAPARSFAHAFETLYRRAFPQLGGIKVALLLDETEKLQRPAWAHDLDDNLRALLTNVPGVTGHLELVMSGGTDFYVDMASEHDGSPLRNVLNEEIKLPSCSPEEMQRLVQEPTNQQVNHNVATAVVQQAGGHLFLGQFLMHHLYREGFEHADARRVQEIAAEFSDRRRDFEGWQTAIGERGCRVYAALAESHTALSKIELARKLGLNSLAIIPELDKLVFHGVADQVERKRYIWRGEMFRLWFMDNVQASRPVTPSSSLPKYNLAELSDKVCTYFNESELRDLCYKLNIDHATLSGHNHPDKARELVEYCKRHGRLDDLVETCRRLRPHVDW